MKLTDPSDLLLTRITPPLRTGEIVTRPRLMMMLDQAHCLPLTLVIAPAGSGKSVLLAEWARQQHTPVAWLTVESGDKDPVRFWRYFSAAVQRAIPNTLLPVLNASSQPGTGTLQADLNILCNTLAVDARPLFIILDDLQAIENREIFTSLAYLIDHQPANLHLIVASRRVPPLPLSRWRAKNRLLEIRGRQLDFTPEDTTSLLQVQLEEVPTEAQVQQAVELTRGWAAGARLFTYALAEQTDWLDALGEGRRLAREYLTGEVIDQLPKRWRNLLEQAAIFNPFQVAMVTAVAGQSASKTAAVLEEVEADRWFWPSHTIPRTQIITGLNRGCPG